jgi:multidrug efflux pump subunit AcrA (membrane-fusion protein)
MTTNVTIYQEEKKGVLMIPRAAVIKEENSRFVLVKQADGAFEKRAIKTGVQSGSEIEVVSGLNEGDTIGISK